MGYYDIPACINYVLKKTGASKLVYIGHSMGTAIFWVAMITHPELNSKIDVMIALAPAASVANVKSLVKFTAPFVTPIEVISKNSFIAQPLFINSLDDQAQIALQLSALDYWLTSIMLITTIIITRFSIETTIWTLSYNNSIKTGLIKTSTIEVRWTVSRWIPSRWIVVK